MKKIMIYLVLLSLMACNKLPSVDCNSPTNEVSLTQKLLKGKWEWTYEKVQNRGFPFYYVTSKEKGYTRQMVFGSNSKIYLYQDNSNEKQLLYRLAPRKEFTSPMDSTLNVLVFETNDKKPFEVLDFRICTDSLYLFVTNHSYEVWSKQ